LCLPNTSGTDSWGDILLFVICRRRRRRRRCTKFS
jgi:hypothetical protein